MVDTRESIYIDVSGTAKAHTLLDFSRLLYHLDLVYEVSRLATDPKYRRYEFPKHTFRPLVSPLDPSDQMMLSRVRHESPWELSVLLHDPVAVLTGGLGALWLFVQCLERVSTLGPNRQKLKAEIDKLRLEAEKLRRELEVTLDHPPAITSGEAGFGGDRVQPKQAKVRTASVLRQPDESDTLVPPDVSVRLYRRLRKCGAERFYESNVNAIRRLGFEVKDLNIRTDDKR
jgi:hypothetical protein